MKRCTLLLLALLASSVHLMASADSTIYKCMVKGKTIYSESPCSVGTTKQQRMDIQDEYMGNVTPDRQTIEGARARIRAGMQTEAVGFSTDAPKRKNTTTCKNLEQHIANLNARSRQPLSGWEQDYINAEKIKAQKQLSDWNC